MSKVALQTKIFTGATTQQTVVDFALASENYRQAFLKSLILYAVGSNTNFTIALRQGKTGTTRTIAVLAVLSGATSMLAGEDLVINVADGDALYITSSVAASVATITLEDYDLA